MNLRSLGFTAPIAARPKVVAPAKPSSLPPTAEEVADVTLLLAAFLNMEEAGIKVLGHTRLSSQLRLEIRSLTKQIQAINLRFQAESGPELNKVIDTLNARGNMANKLNYLLCSCPAEVAEKATNAAYGVVQRWANPPTKKRPARRKSLTA